METRLDSALKETMMNWIWTWLEMEILRWFIKVLILTCFYTSSVTMVDLLTDSL